MRSRIKPIDAGARGLFSRCCLRFSSSIRAFWGASGGVSDGGFLHGLTARGKLTLRALQNLFASSRRDQRFISRER